MPDPVKCPTCGAVLESTLSLNGGPPMPWCLKQKCTAARNKAVLDHIRRNRSAILAAVQAKREGR